MGEKEREKARVKRQKERRRERKTRILNKVKAGDTEAIQDGEGREDGRKGRREEGKGKGLRGRM